MKRNISTKFFNTLQEASQGDCDVNHSELENDYGEFAMSIFSEESANANKASYRNTLIRIRIELSGFLGGTGKKCGNLCKESHRACRQPDRIYRKTDTG